MDPAPLVIVNPVAGPSASRLLERDRLKLALRRRGLSPDWIETQVEAFTSLARGYVYEP